MLPRCARRSPSSNPPSRPSGQAYKTFPASPPSSEPSAYVPLRFPTPYCHSTHRILFQASHTKQHYELIPQPTLAAAEASLRDEIGPFVALLLDRADKHLDRQARRIETLKARADLNAGRLSHYPSPEAQQKPRNNKHESKGRAGGGRMLDGGAALRAKVVRQRKEALQYSVERLELEVLQKERELRMRLDQA